jgi:putative ABC transport system permease protein
MTQPSPPWLTRHVLRHIFVGQDRDCALSDLDEEFEVRAARDGAVAARRWYRNQARRSVIPALQRRLMGFDLSLHIPLSSELRWAWRGVRARGWRAAFVVALLAVALASNAAMFSVSDSLLFNPLPFPDSARLVSIRSRYSPDERPGPNAETDLFNAWSAQRDVFSAVGSYMHKTIFLTGGDTSERVPTADLTTRMLDVLGVRPRWGRGFVEADLLDDGYFAALIREDLARRRFGSPQAALGKRLEATGRPLVIVGVMPEEFAFPSPTFRVWRAFAPGGPLTRNQGWTIAARLADDVPISEGFARVVERAPAVGQAAGYAEYGAEAVPLFTAPTPGERRTLILLLLGAALCLLAAACANATNLELANAVQRARTHAVQLALGAGRGQLGRVAALEGCLLIALALGAGLSVAWLIIPWLAGLLPNAFQFSTRNPISFDMRVIWFTAGLAVASWLLAFFAPALVASRADLASLLKTEDRSSAASAASGRLRRWLTVAEVALTVMLISGGTLYARSYQNLLAVEKGFESRGLAEVSMSMPVGFFTAENPRAQFTDRFMQAFAAVPGVQGVTHSSAPPDMGDSPSRVNVSVDGRVVGDDLMLGRKWVDAKFFAVVGLPLKRGRLLETTDSNINVVIGEALARRLWPDGDPLGHTIQGDEKSPFSRTPLRVVGVVGDFRTAPTRLPDATDERMYVYSLWQESASGRSPPPTASAPLLDTGGSHGIMTVTVRLDSPERLSTVLAAARGFEPRLEVTAMLVDDLYARQNSNTRLAREVVGVFSAVAFVIAIAGVYGVMAFLVAGRRREIGIRMALGASRRDISRLVFGSSLRLILAGGLIGMVAAVAASRWIQSQLFGISPADPVTWFVVMAAVSIVSVLGTWHPASQAARVDPAITLRTE